MAFTHAVYLTSASHTLEYSAYWFNFFLAEGMQPYSTVLGTFTAVLDRTDSWS